MVFYSNFCLMKQPTYIEESSGTEFLFNALLSQISNVVFMVFVLSSLLKLFLRSAMVFVF
jgi:hypothetical protein